MSFVSFLKQFGLDVLKGIQIFEGIEPVATQALQAAGVPVTTVEKIDSLDQMVGSALSIEGSFAAAFGPQNKTGVAKLQALIPQIQQIVANAQAASGKKIGDPALFTKSMQEYAQATVDLVNSWQPSIKTGNSSLPSPSVSPQPMPPVVTSPAPTAK